VLRTYLLYRSVPIYSHNRRGATLQQKSEQPSEKYQRPEATMPTNENNKRGTGAALIAGSDELSPAETKRPRRSSSSTENLVIADLQQQMAKLERQNTSLDAEKVELERLLKIKTRQREANDTKILWLKEQLLQQQLGDNATNNENPRIQEVLRIYKTGTIELDDLLEQQFSELIDNCDFYYAFLEAKDKIPLTGKVNELMERHQPQQVLNKQELMLQLCKYDPWVLADIPEGSPLKSDVQVLEAVLECLPSMVGEVSGTMQLQNPLLVGKALARLPLWHSTVSNHFKSFVEDSLWHNRDVVLGWAKGGGELHNRIPVILRRNDPEILLTFVGSVKPTIFQNPVIIPRFRRDKEFLRKAVAKNPYVLQCVANNLKGDVDLGIAALSGPHGTLAVLLQHEGFLPNEEGTVAANHRFNRFWIQVAEQIRQKVRLHDAFSKLILGSVHFSHTKPSHFSILGQDDATSEALTKTIAEFAGVPVGNDLAMLRRARKTLEMVGIRWFD